jgi:hypothetical protein
MAAALADNPKVLDVVQGDQMILPGESYSVEVKASGDRGRLSLAGMFVTTNDAFYGLDSLPLFGDGPKRRMVYGTVYDAGSEANNEDCDFIPGPPCGNGGVRDTDGAEGFVHIHRGIQGVGDLNAADMDWRNPGVEIEIVRTRK